MMPDSWEDFQSIEGCSMALAVCGDVYQWRGKQNGTIDIPNDNGTTDHAVIYRESMVVWVYTRGHFALPCKTCRMGIYWKIWRRWRHGASSVLYQKMLIADPDNGFIVSAMGAKGLNSFWMKWFTIWILMVTRSTSDTLNIKKNIILPFFSNRLYEKQPWIKQSKTVFNPATVLTLTEIIILFIALSVS